MRIFLSINACSITVILLICMGYFLLYLNIDTILKILKFFYLLLFQGTAREREKKIRFRRLSFWDF